MCMHACMPLCVHTCVYVVCIHAYLCVHMCVRVCVHVCPCVCIHTLFYWQVQHNRVQSVKKIANNFEDLVNRQNDHTVSLLKHQTVIVEREGIQKRFADLKHCLEEAQVM